MICETCTALLTLKYFDVSCTFRWKCNHHLGNIIKSVCIESILVAYGNVTISKTLPARPLKPSPVSGTYEIVVSSGNYADNGTRPVATYENKYPIKISHGASSPASPGYRHVGQKSPAGVRRGKRAGNCAGDAPAPGGNLFIPAISRNIPPFPFILPV